MILIGAFYIMTTFLGFGAATLVGKANIVVHVSGAKATAFIAAHPAEAAAQQQPRGAFPGG
jgi:Na+(H+)/acetate symporter ActP